MTLSESTLNPDTYRWAFAALVSAVQRRYALESVEPLLFTHAREIAPIVEQRQATQDASAYALSLAETLAGGKFASQPPKQVLSVFAQLRGQVSSEERYLPLRSLEIHEDMLFPVQRDPAADAHVQLDSFTTSVRELGQQKGIGVDLRADLESLLSLMQRHFWCVSSGYENAEDIALYDHARVMAALAASFQSLEMSTLQSLRKAPYQEIEVATLIEGDISGIQRFIYSVPMRGAAKQLRARSLYLQLLTETAARHILRELDLPITNLLYTGGGHFYIVAQAGIKERLQTIIKQLEMLLLNHHDGEIYLAIGSVPLNAKDFKPSEFGGKWKALKESTGHMKSQRYSQLEAGELKDLVFSPRPQDGSDERSLRYQDRDEREDDSGAPIEAVSQFGESLKKFATKLKNAEAIVLSYLESPLQVEAGELKNVFHALGFSVDFVYSDGFKRMQYPSETQQLDYAVALGLREQPDARIVETLHRNLGCAVAPSIRYTVNITPMVGEDFRPVEFDELAEAAQGIKRIGVLRMDVDDLGSLFGSGFKDKQSNNSRASLVRVATLSNALSLYFEGWVGRLCEEFNEQQRDIVDEHGRRQKVGTVYAVYSGGDDLFLVGTWDLMPELARRIHDDFSRYACHNPAVHISAGITLHTGRYPLYLAAEEAESALTAAKQVDSGKNAINFLGQTVKWESEWLEVLHYANVLYELIENQGANRSLLRAILQLYEEYETSRREFLLNRSGDEQIVWGPWMWHMAYKLNRLAALDKKNQVQIDALHQRISESTHNYRGIVWAGIAARWVDACTRSKNESEE